MAPRALIEKPSADGKWEKCQFGSEKLGNKGGCQLGDGESSGGQRCHLIITPLFIYQPSCQICSNFKCENLPLQVSLIFLPSLAISFPSNKQQQQNTMFRFISFNYHTCSLSQNCFPCKLLLLFSTCLHLVFRPLSNFTPLSVNLVRCVPSLIPT